MNARAYEIAAAMNGRQASAVNDSALHDAVREKLITLAQDAGRPLASMSVSGITACVLRAAARTLIFEAEVPIALDMGAKGELEHEATAVNQTNAARWVTAYACCGDRRAAQEHISLQAARDRKRADEVSRDELRTTFEREGLARAWEQFRAEGWTIQRPGYAAALYNRIGRDALRSVLDTARIAAAKADAVAALRHDDPRRYRTMPEEEVLASPTLQLYYKAQLCRAYFETLAARGLDINLKPAAL